METEENNPQDLKPKKNKKMLRSSGVLMAVLIVVLGIYYTRINMMENKAKEKNVEKLKQDSLLKSAETKIIPVADLDSVLDVNYLMGKINPAKEISFTQVAIPYGNREGLYLREEVYGAFIKMYNAALRDGVKLVVISAARSFDYQKGIWEAKWSGKREVNGKNLAVSVPDPVERAKQILTYSAMPGTSRHHWGTDLDMNSMDPKYFDTEAGKKIYNWLSVHASEYDFGQPYCAKGEKRSTGYEEEKWHWSYLPISKQCLNAYKTKVTYADITGFSGSETAAKIKVIEDYVFGINPDCK
jgi:zinc D-Ala-D-Ala carboxypeptidase